MLRVSIKKIQNPSDLISGPPFPKKTTGRSLFEPLKADEFLYENIMKQKCES